MSDHTSTSLIEWHEKSTRVAADPGATLAVSRAAWEQLGAVFIDVDDGQGEIAGLATATVRTPGGPVLVGIVDYGENASYLLVPGGPEERVATAEAVLDTLESAGAIQIDTDLLNLSHDTPAPTLDERITEIERKLEQMFGRESWARLGVRVGQPVRRPGEADAGVDIVWLGTASAQRSADSAVEDASDATPEEAGEQREQGFATGHGGPPMVVVQLPDGTEFEGYEHTYEAVPSIRKPTTPRGDVHTTFDGRAWINRVEGDEQVSASAPTKAQAQRVGRDMAKARGVRHIVHTKDGRSVTRGDYGSQRERQHSTD